MHVHISNLHSNIIESDLQRLFSQYGEVELVQLVRDKLNHRSLGHAYINMPVRKQALQAIVSLNGTQLQNKKITVLEVVYDPAPHASWSHSQNA